MTCDCLEKLQDSLRERFDDPKGSLDTAMILNFETGVHLIKWPTTDFEYTPKKANGEPSKKKSKQKIIPAYCPVCGKKYEI